MKQDERIRRWVDDELDAAELEALRAQAAREPQLARALAQARETQDALALLRREGAAAPSDDLVERSVRNAVRRRLAEEEAASSMWHWLWRPQVLRLRVSPLTAALGAALVGALVVGWLQSSKWAPGSSRWAHDVPRQAAQDEAAQDEAPSTVEQWADAIRDSLTVPIRFVMPAEGASSVAVAGDFNAWQTDAAFLEDEDGDGVFVGTVRLPPGTYAYAFVVDGERWVADPFASNYRDDGFGTRNAVLRIDGVRID